MPMCQQIQPLCEKPKGLVKEKLQLDIIYIPPFKDNKKSRCSFHLVYALVGLDTEVYLHSQNRLQ